MAEELAKVVCLCGQCCCEVLSNSSPECVEKIICCPLILCDKGCNDHCEAGLRCWCKCCCGFLKMWALSCSNSGSSYYYINCGDTDWGISATVLCGIIVAICCLLLGIVCEVTANSFGDNQCNAPIDTHVVVQGVVLIGDAIVLIYVLGKYYIPKSITFPTPHAAVFPRFHGLFARDWVLAILLGAVSLGFWWSILGYYWLAGVECDPEDDFLLTTDSFAIAVEFILVLFLLLLVYIVIAIAACDEGSCRFGSAGLDCFLCCCICCLKTPDDFEQRRRQQAAAAREAYSSERSTCLKVLMDILKLCGCIRPGYTRRSLTDMSVMIPDEPNQEPDIIYPPTMNDHFLSPAQTDVPAAPSAPAYPSAPPYPTDPASVEDIQLDIPLPSPEVPPPA